MRVRCGWWVAVVCVVLGAGVASPAAAQISGGALTGRVADKSGTAVPGATVTVVAQRTNATRTVVTNSSGLYSVPALSPGTYTVRVEQSGFKSLNRRL